MGNQLGGVFCYNLEVAMKEVRSGDGRERRKGETQTREGGRQAGRDLHRTVLVVQSL